MLSDGMKGVVFKATVSFLWFVQSWSFLTSMINQIWFSLSRSMGILKEFSGIFSLFLILDFLFVLNELLETLKFHVDSYYVSCLYY